MATLVWMQGIGCGGELGEERCVHLVESAALPSAFC